MHFFPKFYCELNPIEMVSISLNLLVSLSYFFLVLGVAQILLIKLTKKPSKMRMPLNNILKHVPLMSYNDSLITLQGSWVHITLDWQDMQWCGLSRSKSSIIRPLSMQWHQLRLCSMHLDKIWHPSIPPHTPKKLQKFGQKTWHT